MRRRRIRARRAAPTGTPRSASTISTWASRLCRARSSSVGSEPMLWVPNTTSTHGALRRTRVAVLLGQAAADGDLHVGIGLLARREVAEVAVQLVVGVLPHRAGVEDDDVGVGAVGRALVAGRLQQPGQPFGVVHVHLAAVGADLVGAPAGEQARAMSPPAPPSKSRPHGTDGPAQRSEWIREFQASWTFPG